MVGVWVVDDESTPGEVVGVGWESPEEDVAYYVAPCRASAVGQRLEAAGYPDASYLWRCP